LPKHDRYYTPQGLAEELVGFHTGTSPRVVADFAAGGGELLSAAESRWPKATYLATDIDSSALRKLQCVHGEWRIGKTDFLNGQSRSRCRALTGMLGNVDLVLLNPPFSSRGGQREVHIREQCVYTCSRALGFVLHALEYLSAEGQVLAILPAGTLLSEKDEAVWASLYASYCVEVLGHCHRNAFPDCRPLASIVRLSKGGTIRPPAAVIGSDFNLAFGGRVIVVRGNLPMYIAREQASRRGLHVVHTTNIVCQEVKLNGLRNLSHGQHFCGPGVLIPRVGAPSRSKVVVYESKQPIVLSDCLFGIKCGSKRSAHLLKERIHLAWDEILPLYGGTGAPYITRRRLVDLMVALGFSPASA
jgi:predicted RNA methylase